VCGSSVFASSFSRSIKRKVFGSKFKVWLVVALGIFCFYSRAALTRKMLVIVGTFPLPSNNKGIQSDKKSLSRFLQRAQKAIQLILPFNLALGIHG
jgi:hypothetical protein